MKNMYGKSVLVGAIIGILAVGVSFAGFTATLTVNGTAELTGDFNVKFTAATKQDLNGAETTVPDAGTLSSGVLSFDASTQLQRPGSKSTITYTISNLGSIDATLSTPTITCYSAGTKLEEEKIDCVDENVSITVSEPSVSTINGTGGLTTTATGTITAEWLSTSETVPEQTARYYTVSIVANQIQ